MWDYTASLAFCYSLEAANARFFLEAMQRASRQMLRRDRDANVQRLRMMAEEAANHDNMSKSFAIAKVLAGRTVKKVDALKEDYGTR